MDRGKGLVCVTGASGFIGSHLVRELLERGYAVRAAVRNTADDERVQHLRRLVENSEARLQLMSGDLRVAGAFDPIVSGCDFVCHSAQAVAFTAADPQREIVDLALNGTRELLRAARRAGSVKRFVYTSSIAAIVDYTRPETHVFTDRNWPENLTVRDNPYGLSKTLSERAVWEDQDRAEGEGFDAVSINPGMVFGPIYSKGHLRTSPSIIRNILAASYPGCPPLEFNVVDVRDVATAHVNALERPEAKGKRIILVDRALTWRQMAEIIARHFPERRISTRELPKWLLYAVAVLDKRVSFSFFRNNLGRRFRYDNQPSRQLLGLRYRGPENMLLDACGSLVRLGLC